MRRERRRKLKNFAYLFFLPDLRNFRSSILLINLLRMMPHLASLTHNMIFCTCHINTWQLNLEKQIIIFLSFKINITCLYFIVLHGIGEIYTVQFIWSDKSLINVSFENSILIQDSPNVDNWFLDFNSLTYDHGCIIGILT